MMRTIDLPPPARPPLGVAQFERVSVGWAGFQREWRRGAADSELPQRKEGKLRSLMGKWSQEMVFVCF